MRSSEVMPGWVTYAAGAAALVIALGGILVLTTRAGKGPGAEAPPAPAPGQPPPAAEKFTPPTRSEGASAVMPLVFVDGSSLEVLYDSSLGLAALGAVPLGSARLEGCCQRQFLIDRGPQGTFYDPSRRSAQIPGRDGQTVGVFRAPKGESGDFLVWHFGSWTVGISDGSGRTQLTDAQRSQWATGLGGRETPEGFLLIEATAPLRIEPVGGVAGPSMEIGSIRSKGVLVIPGPCSPPVGNGVETRDGFALRRSTLVGKFEVGVMCHAEAKVGVNVYGEAGFVSGVLKTLKVRNVRLQGV